MSKNKQKLELTWIGKDREVNLEPRILVEVPEKSYGDKDTQNMLIHGDNLLALKALEQDFAGKIKCIYIDPPFNTGSAFEHYDDNVEHSKWLSLMKQRLEILHKLLSEDGFLMIHLDDCEAFYTKILLDEIFDRKNYVNTITMTTNDPSGFKATSNRIFSTSNYILIYAKSNLSILNKVYIQKSYDKAYSKVLINKHEPFENWKWTNITDIVATQLGFENIQIARKELSSVYDKEIANTIIDKKIEQYAISNAENVFRTAAISGGAKIKRNETINKSKILKNQVLVHPNEDVKDFYILNGEQIIFYENRLNYINGNKVPVQFLTDVWTDISWTGIANEGNVEFKNGKKPEKLIMRCIELATNKDDIVLDSFLGSATTAAVAHKMGRKWIGIELGDHCYTHCEPRLQKVVDGTDQGGISKAVNWQGGGGYKFYELAPSLLKKDEFDNWIIEPKYDAEMLAEAMAKHEGYKFSPDETNVYKQGKSTEKDFIFTTTQFISLDLLNKIASQINEDESLLICATHFEEGIYNKFSNITIKKIPQILLDRCEFGKLEYNLNIIEENQPEDFEEEETLEDEE